MGITVSNFEETTAILKYCIISMLPIKNIKQVKNFVWTFSFKKLPDTIIIIQIAKMKNGKGTGVPGTGMHAVFLSFIIYPGSHSKEFGTHPIPAELT